MGQPEGTKPLVPIHPVMSRVMARRHLLRAGDTHEFQQQGVKLHTKTKQARAAQRAQLEQTAQMVQREDITLANAQGFYNPGQLLIDICGDNDLTSLTLAGSYSPLFDIIGFDFSNVYKVEEGFITYIGPSGTAAATPTTGVLSAACTRPNGVEWGNEQLRHSGWTSLARTSPSRDVTEMHMRLCDNAPTYRVDGTLINNDFEWDMVTMMSVIMQDMHRMFVIGNATNDNEADGLQRLVRTGVTDTDGSLFPQMDSFIVDWNGNAMAPDNGATGVTLNGNATADGYVLIDFINSWIRHTVGRINMAPRLRGTPLFTCLIPTEHLSCLIYAYANYFITGNPNLTTNVNNDDVIAMRNRLIRDAIEGMVTLVFEGYPITFIPWDWETVDEVTGNGDLYFLTAVAGTIPMLRLHLKDMNQAVRNGEVGVPAGTASGRFVLDGGRILGQRVEDHNCEYRTARLDFRPILRAPWTAMKITDVACNTIFGHLSADPLSAFFPGAGALTVDPAASSTTTLGNAAGMP